LMPLFDVEGQGFLCHVGVGAEDEDGFHFSSFVYTTIRRGRR